ncbi:CHASE3 domain-containing protein [Roseimaritima multifibrata]|uniref:CHASE3 domain-containing protein n=1 Tax=Roseimaritima multifibrata TaxID=1930274 RepID=UPI001C54C6DA|nr:CHASE3 domain-containing protein [Roseimaritima multifibrata]
MPDTAPHRRSQRLLEPFAVSAVVVLLVASGLISFQNTRRLRLHTDLVSRSHELLSVLRDVESDLRSAESGQRGYVVTGQEIYLGPYESAMKHLDVAMRDLEVISENDPVKQAELIELRKLVAQKSDELAATIDLRRESGFEDAQLVVATNIGRRTMESIHDQIVDFRRTEELLISEREQRAATTYWLALATGLVSTIAGLILVLSVLYMVQWNRRRAEQFAEAIETERDQLQATLDRVRSLESDKERLDKYMRTFLEQIEDYAIFAMDADFRATTWNRGILKVLGFHEEEFIGKDVRSLIFTPEAQALGIPDAEFAAAVAAGSASDDRWMMRKGGKRFWASGISSVVRDRDDNVVGYSKVMRDLTERKRDHDALAELAARLSESDRRKNEFLATLAHELRNPLAPIKNAVQLMGMSKLDDESEELRQTMARQIEQMVRLIDDLLDVSRISRGKINLRKEVTDLRSVIKAAVEASNTFITEKKQHLKVDIEDKSVPVNCDPARMTQVVSNLLNNSSRYSDANCLIELGLTTETRNDGKEWATILIQDNGIGIAPDRINEIFQMFAQVDNTLERDNAGLGIGLTLVKTLAEVHGGTVSASSDGIGKGSRFSVCIPISTESVASSGEIDADLSTPFRSFKVLVVEDMAALRKIMASLLTKLGHHVEVAESGSTAIEHLKSYQPDVIFSDISMPGMTGYDLVKQLRKNPATAQIYMVAMTGFGQSSDRKTARESGFDEHMIKPVDITKLQDLFTKLAKQTAN